MSVNMNNTDSSTSEATTTSVANEEWYAKYKKVAANFVPYDPRFPNQNQTRNCQQNYIDYHRCLNKKDGDEDYCAWYKNAYKQMCPPEWYERWDEQRESGIFPTKLN